jgi:hypothetical protein
VLSAQDLNSATTRSKLNAGSTVRLVARFFPHENVGASGSQKVQRFHGLSADMFALSYGK